MKSPFEILQEWIERERELGAPSPNRIVLATADTNGIPQSRVVAIREISSQGVLFFTQRCTKKARTLIQNPAASMTLWLELQQKQAVLDGKVERLTQEENELYWKEIPRDQQLRFSAYAPTSGQIISSVEILEVKLKELRERYKDEEIPMSAEYCGFRFITDEITFYTLGSTTFSEHISFRRKADSWITQVLSP